MNTTPRVRAPEFPAEATWINAERPLSMAEDLAGQVVVLDFWTYCCINCLHTLPVLSRIEQRFLDRPVAVIGVHSAKFLTEGDPAHIRRAVERYHVQHPVVVDSTHDVWQSYTVRAWPTLILVDAEGYVRDEIRGEAEEDDLAARIEALLEEAGARGTLAEHPIDARPEASSDHRLLFYPGKVAADEQRIYVADSGHHRVIVASHDGRIERIVGGVRGVGHVDGRYDAVAFNDPQGMSSDGSTLYIADRGNHFLRALDLDLFWVRTLAGTGHKGTSRGAMDPARPLEVALRSPWDVQCVAQYVLIAMAGSHQIWLYDTEKHEIGAWAGSGAEDHVDGALHEAAFAQPSGLDLVGTWLMIADSEVSSVRAIDLQEGQAATLVGQGLFDFGDVDGEGDQALLQHPLDVAAIDDVLYVADTYNHKIKAIDLRTRVVTTAFGDGTTDLLNEPGGMCAVGDRLLVADTNHHRVVWVDPRSGQMEELVLRGSGETTAP